VTAGDPVVDATNDIGVAALGVSSDGVRVLAPNNERSRIVDEEIPSLDAAGVAPEATEYEWYEASVRDATATHHRGPAAADVSVPGLERLSVESIRAPMLPVEREQYRDTCEETTEREAAGALLQPLRKDGFRVSVVLVGGAERSQRYRHYTPRDGQLDEFALLTVVAERGGHNVAVTRTVAFDPPTWLRKRHDAACRVAATAVAATREAGVADLTVGDVFNSLVEAYDAVGFEGEWCAHHQGGAIGPETREWVATPDGADTVTVPMPFACNPIIQGAKYEDTVLVTESDAEVITKTGDWPTTSYEAVGYDERIAFHDPLLVE
jgi:hypothetical protein